jgi:hypothetical protein
MIFQNITGVNFFLERSEDTMRFTRCVGRDERSVLGSSERRSATDLTAIRMRDCISLIHLKEFGFRNEG